MQNDGDTVDDAMRTGVSGTTDGVVITINQRVAHLIPARRSAAYKCRSGFATSDGRTDPVLQPLLVRCAAKGIGLLAASSRLPV